MILGNAILLYESRFMSVIALGSANKCKRLFQSERRKYCYNISGKRATKRRL